MDITINKPLHQIIGGLNTSPLGDNLNDDEFAFTRAEKIKLAHLTTGSTGGGGGSVTATPVTYSELVALADASGFTAEQTYLITDYQTVHYMFDGNTRLDEINTGSTEPLLIKAATVNTIYPEAYSTLYPQDIINYDFKSDYWTLDIAFANAENAGGSILQPDLTNVSLIPGYKGVIYKREDTKNNVIIGYDFRNVKFRRFATEYDIANGSDIYWGFWSSSSGVTDPSIYMDCLTFHGVDEWNTYEVSVKNVISDSIHENNIIYNGNVGSSLSNNVFYLSGNNSYNQIHTCYDNKLGTLFELNTIGNYFSDNTIGNSFNSNTIGNSFNHNTIGHFFTSNTIGNDFNSNTIGNDFNSNIIGDDFNSNTFNNQNSSNIIGFGFNSNIFNNNNQHNTFGNNCYSNTFANYNQYNTFGNNIQHNTFKNNCTLNTFGNSIVSNIFGFNNQSNTYGDSFQFNIFGDNCTDNTFGNSFISNTFDTYAQQNILTGTCSQNMFGPGFSGNNFGCIISGNTFESNFKNNHSTTTNNTFKNNIVNSEITSLDFTSSTHVYQPYTCTLYLNSSGNKKLIYDGITIVDANE